MNHKTSVAAALIVLCALQLPGAADSLGQAKFKIHLQSREFVPSPGIDPKLRSKLQSADLFPVHGIVQLFGVPSKLERASLVRAGVQLQQFLGQTTYLAAFSQNTAFDTVTNLVRWAGLLLPEDKTEGSLRDGRIENWAKADADRIKVLARFYSDVSAEDARKILGRHTLTFRPFGLNSEWAIEISQEKVKGLAAEPSVRWLEQGPSSGRPLSSSNSIGR